MNFDFQCVKGDAANICVDCKDDDGNAIDLTPYLTAPATIEFALKFSTQDADVAAIFIGTLTGGAITVLDPPEDGVLQALIPGANTATMLLFRPYFWSVRLTDGVGTPFTPTTGTLIATPDAQ